MESGWVDSFYEALEFFYWEPQHLGRKKYDKAEFNSLPLVQKHLRKMEVTLNQNLHQFFLLAPSSLRNKLFGSLFGQPLHEPFKLEGRDVDAKFNLQNSTQPDLVFISDTNLVSIEMKVGAKSSLTQVLKYALLGLAVEVQQGSVRNHHLALLGTGSFAAQWKEPITSMTELRDSLAQADLESFLKKQPAHLRPYSFRFSEIVSSLSFCFITYEELTDHLMRDAPISSDTSPGAEVYRKLISGLIAELKFRQLAP